MELRYYQAEAVQAAYAFLRDRPGQNPCIVLPTGAGKTPVLASLCNDAVTRWGGRVLVLSHVKELVEQSAGTLRAWFPHLDVGVYSAGLKSRDTANAVVCAGIQSVAGRGFELCGEEPFNLVLVDECHRIPTDGEGRYVSLLSDLATANPNVRLIGLTATNYRTGEGYVCGPDNLLHDVCYEASVKTLIAQGWLSQLTSKQSGSDADLSSVSVRRGDYSQAEMEDAFEAIVESAVDEILTEANGRNHVLVFCAGVDHAYHVADELKKRGVDCPVVTGQTNDIERDAIVSEFKAGRIRFLANVNCFTEGFDATCVDMVVLLRATLSTGLYYQMVGRGLRLHPGKADCKILDFGGNVLRHGCIDSLVIKTPNKEKDGEAPAKACPECQEVVPAGYAVCTACGHEFPPPEPTPRHAPTASNAAVLSDDVKPLRYVIDDVGYVVHKKRGADEDAPRSMRVMYYEGMNVVAEEWVCVEHRGFAREKALAWWDARSSMAMPNDADLAVKIAELGGIAEPNVVEVVKPPGERFARIVKYELGEVPEPVDPNADPIDLDEVPF